MHLHLPPFSNSRSFYSPKIIKTKKSDSFYKFIIYNFYIFKGIPNAKLIQKFILNYVMNEIDWI